MDRSIRQMTAHVFATVVVKLVKQMFGTCTVGDVYCRCSEDGLDLNFNTACYYFADRRVNPHSVCVDSVQTGDKFQEVNKKCNTLLPCLTADVTRVLPVLECRSSLSDSLPFWRVIIIFIFWSFWSSAMAAAVRPVTRRHTSSSSSPRQPAAHTHNLNR